MLVGAVHVSAPSADDVRRVVEARSSHKAPATARAQPACSVSASSFAPPPALSGRILGACMFTQRALSYWQAVRPDAVVVELCRSRAALLYSASDGAPRRRTLTALSLRSALPPKQQKHTPVQQPDSPTRSWGPARWARMLARCRLKSLHG